MLGNMPFAAASTGLVEGSPLLSAKQQVSPREVEERMIDTTPPQSLFVKCPGSKVRCYVRVRVGAIIRLLTLILLPGRA